MASKYPRIVLLTSGLNTARSLSHCLTRLDIYYDLVTICPPLPCKNKLSWFSYIWVLFDRYVRSINLLRRLKQLGCQSFPVPSVYARFCNGQRLLRILGKLNPDYIIMMGGGILSADVIRTARIGVLNAHPGLIPWMRGVDVLRWALLRDVALGVTGHYIDPGIDTGPVICRYLLPIKKKDTYEDLKARSKDLTVATMLSMVQRIWDGQKLVAKPQSAKYELCRLMPPDRILTVDALFADGKALDLRHQWEKKKFDIEMGEAILENYYRQLSATTL